MSQYIILVDARDGGPGIAVVADSLDNIKTFDDIAEAVDLCKTNPLCKCYPCEIINIDDLGWGD